MIGETSFFNHSMATGKEEKSELKPVVLFTKIDLVLHPIAVSISPPTSYGLGSSTSVLPG